MLKIIQHFSKHYSFHLQDKHVMAGHFWKLYIGQAVGGKFDLMVLIGGAEEWLTVPLDSCTNNPTCHLLLALYEAPKNTQPLHIYPEDDNCNVC
jgi:hypothetical protein